MTKLSQCAWVAAIALISLTGCSTNNQNPYGYYNNGVIPPPATGAYGNYNTQNQSPYYQAYQTPPPVGYGQPNAASPYQNWQTNGNVNVAANQPVFQNNQIVPANFDAPYPNETNDQNVVQPTQNVDQPQFQPSQQMNFDSSGFNDQQGSLNQMHINQPGAQFESSQAVMIPVNNNAYVDQNYAVQAGYSQPMRYVPVDPGAIVLPQNNPNFQQNFVTAYESTTTPGSTGGTAVARNTTMANHNPQWQGNR